MKRKWRESVKSPENTRYELQRMDGRQWLEDRERWRQKSSKKA